MLDGRYPSAEFGELRPRIVWDRVAGHDPRAQGRAASWRSPTRARSPTAACTRVTLPDGRRVGELDEEMVYEARPGQTFLLGASTWRIEEIGRDRVIVTPAPGAPGAVPFWQGDGVGRPKELGEAIGAFAREARRACRPRSSRATTTSTSAPPATCSTFLREQQDATRVVPSDRTIVVERFRDEIGDWRLCVLSPYGGRVHAAWALALSRAASATSSASSPTRSGPTTGIIVHLPDADEPPGAELVLVEPDESRTWSSPSSARSALFGARFRENAGARAADPARLPRPAHAALAAAAEGAVAARGRQALRRVPDHPRDLPRVPARRARRARACEELLRELHTRELSLVEVETPTASPFASSLLFDYVATYMYEGDTPNAERRAAALSLDRDLLRELLGQEELRDLIDPGALDAGRGRPAAPLASARAPTIARRAARRAAPRRRPDRRRGAGRACSPGSTPARMLDDARARAPRGRACAIGGEERWIAAEDAGLYRDALGAVPPGGLPEAFLDDGPRRRSSELARRYARTHGPFTTGEVRARYGVDLGPRAARRSSAPATLVRGELRPGGTRARVVRPGRAAAAAPRLAGRRCARRSSRPTSARSRASCPAWQGVDRHPRRGRRRRPPARGARPAPGPGAARRGVGARRAAAPRRRLLAGLAGPALRERRGRLGRRRRARAHSRPRRALLPRGRRGDRPAGRAGRASRRRPSPSTRRSASGSRAAPCFFTDLLAELPSARAGGAPGGAVGPRLGGRGDQRRVRAAARAAADARPRAARRRAAAARAASAPRRGAAPRPQVQGRWSLTAPLFARRARPARARRAHRRAAARALRHRHARAGARRGRPRRLLGALRRAQRPRDARRLPPRLLRRGPRRRAVRAARRGRAAARHARDDAEERALVLAATDPAQPYGAALPLARAATATGARPARVPGAYVVLVGAEPVLYVERGGRGPAGRCASADDPRLRRALEALAELRDGRRPRAEARARALRRRAGRRLRLGASADRAGFRQGPRKLDASA